MQTILKSLYWILLQEISVKLISFVTSLILLWYLSPSEFGRFFFVWLFFSVFAVWRNGGAQEVIIRYGTDKSELWQAQFWQIQLKSVYSLCLLILLLVFDEFIFGFTLSYSLWGFMALIFMLEGIYCIPQYIGELQKDFKTIFKWYFLAELIASVSGIWLASKGLGLYALSVKMLVSAALKTAGMWTSFYFPSGSILRNLPSAEKQFGQALSYTKLMNYMARNADDFMIGRYLGDAALGLYNRVYNVSLYPLLQWGSSVNRAILPEAGNFEKHKSAALFINLFSFNMYAYSIAALAMYWWCPTLVLVFLPDVWHPAAPLFKIFAWILLLQGMARPNSLFFTLTGETRLELKLNIILKIHTFIWLAVGVFLFENIEMVVLCYLAAVVFSAVLQWIYLRRILELSEKWWKSALTHVGFLVCCWLLCQYMFGFSPHWSGFLLIAAVMMKLILVDRQKWTGWKALFAGQD